MNRKCGNCTLCCKLVPVEELRKPAGKKCSHQGLAGCRIYADRPRSCRAWSCRWLVDPAATMLTRPDRAHYVIDMMPDFIEAKDHETGEKRKLPVLQVWCDTDYPDAHRDPALREFIVSKQVPALIRFNNDSAIVLTPPTENHSNWLELPTTYNPDLVHSMQDKLDVLKELGVVV